MITCSLNCTNFYGRSTVSYVKEFNFMMVGASGHMQLYCSNRKREIRLLHHKSHFNTLLYLTTCGLLLQPMNRMEVCNMACKGRLFPGHTTPLQLHANFCICQRDQKLQIVCLF